MKEKSHMGASLTLGQEKLVALEETTSLFEKAPSGIPYEQGGAMRKEFAI